MMSKNGKSVSKLEIGQTIDFAGKTKIKIIELEKETNGKREGIISVIKAWVDQDYLLGDKFRCSFENSPQGDLHIFIQDQVEDKQKEKRTPVKKGSKKEVTKKPVNKPKVKAKAK